eukprot:scaffold1107_cov185-Pinguiococcus_pyrenoidosus.AAC.5
MTRSTYWIQEASSPMPSSDANNGANHCPIHSLRSSCSRKKCFYQGALHWGRLRILPVLRAAGWIRSQHFWARWSADYSKQPMVVGQS